MVEQTGILIISLDFELIWGIRDFVKQDKAENILVTRQVVPRLLKLFSEFGIHATWATVGFLFFETRDELFASLPSKLPAYSNSALSPYENLRVEVGADEEQDLFHFAPSLIRQIIDTPHQELATHTFSHYYCLEDGQTPGDFESDLRSALHAAKKYGREIKCIIFPRNQYNDLYLDVCKANGILAYRGNENLWFRQSSKRRMHRHWSRRIMRVADAYINISGSNSYSIPMEANRPINLPSSRYLRPYSKKISSFEHLRLRRITSSMSEAARLGQIFHLWWHPEDFSKHIDENFNFLRSILEHYAELRDTLGMRSRTMEEVALQVIDPGADSG